MNAEQMTERLALAAQTAFAEAVTAAVKESGAVPARADPETVRKIVATIKGEVVAFLEGRDRYAALHVRVQEEVDPPSVAVMTVALEVVKKIEKEKQPTAQ